MQPTTSTDSKDSQRDENEAGFLKNIFEPKDLATNPSPVVTKTTQPRLPATAFSEADASADSSHQAKRRVRRRCPVVHWCPHPTKRRLRQKRPHHKRAHHRHQL